MTFEYLETIKRDASIEIDTPGQTNIQGFTDEGDQYFLSIKTKMGFTTVKQFGPYDEEGKPQEVFSYSRFELEYNEKKVKKIIQDYLTGRVPKTQVFEVDDQLINEILENTRL